MTTIPATRARQQWAQKLDEAKKAPETITEHGRETVVLMDAELSRRALEALEDAEDAREAAEILSRIESGQERTYTMAEVAAELGVTVEEAEGL
ncbi:type II toxin-antitoxin system Phd/YefM family antitoxin [Glaciibacter superstes]|uniref:type II toxin-antitoxin system Phd/YefM family antitoxin n=1 Tax=Glaciibacter superstes TaxID=501023 RepID=UPI0003B6AC58|nr:type II toxin-antitoxin system Phd/YefM family antitoxin [Glaciibacter superstes]